jgi:hypothetical protein
MHHEHRTRNLAEALAAVARGLELVGPESHRDVRAWHQAEGFERRRRRLVRKVGRRGES